MSSSDLIIEEKSSTELLFPKKSLTTLSSDDEGGKPLCKEKEFKEIYKTLGLTGDDNEHINLNTFRRIISNNLDVDPSFMFKRVFNAFDRQQNGYLTSKQFVEAIAILLHGPFQAHVELGLRVYGHRNVMLDAGDKSGHEIPRGDEFSISKADAISSIVESLQLSTPRSRYTLTTDNREKAYHIGQDLVFIIYPKLDVNGDGIISLDDFLKACYKDPTLIQVFGQYIPRNTGVKPEVRVAEGSPSKSGITTFQGIDYMKHSPTIGTMWGRNDGPNADKKSEKWDPLPVQKN